MRAQLRTTVFASGLAAALGLLAVPLAADDKIEMGHGDGQASVERRLEPTAPPVKGDRVRTADESEEILQHAPNDRQAEQSQGRSQQGQSAQSGGPAPEGDGKGAGSGQQGDVPAGTVQDVKEQAKDDAGEAGGGKEKTAEKGGGKEQGGKEQAAEKPEPSENGDEQGMSEQARKSIEDHAQGYFARMKDRGVPVDTY